ncbi:polyprenyl synthetase family protein, partial [Actinotalea sp.]|uniref:polyprenyl synthetase family protein n=1 Tax=Actinotalea sp. TaxID=1872145 RepID=UPI0035658809
MSPLVLAPRRLDDQVTAALDAVLEHSIARASAYGPRFVLMWSEIARSVRGGKRFRSGLVLGAHTGLGGPHPDAAVAVAGAFEVLHTAFLVHDDLIDGDTMRRGEPNLGETMRRDAVADGLGGSAAERWSAASAVLAGDLAIALAHRLVAGLDVPAPLRLAL